MTCLFLLVLDEGVKEHHVPVVDGPEDEARRGTGGRDGNQLRGQVLAVPRSLQ